MAAPKTEPEVTPVKAEPQDASTYPDTAPKEEQDGDDVNIKTEFDGDGSNQQYGGGAMQGMDFSGAQNGGYGGGTPAQHEDRPIYHKDDG